MPQRLWMTNVIRLLFLVESQLSSASTDDATRGDAGNPGDNGRVKGANLQRPSPIEVNTERKRAEDNRNATDVKIRC